MFVCVCVFCYQEVGNVKEKENNVGENSHRDLQDHYLFSHISSWFMAAV